MKIAINCAFYQPKGGGIKEYIHNLLHQFSILQSDNEFIVYVLQDQYDYAKKFLPQDLKIKKIPFNSGSLSNRIKRSLLEGRFWRREEQTEGFDLFHSPFFHAPRLRKTPVMLTVHDLRLYRFPQTYEFFRYQFLKKRVKDSIRKADHIISISDFTKEEIENLIGVEPGKVTVVHEAINRESFSDKGLKEPKDLPEELKKHRFLLSVGHMEPRKNYDRLLDAYLKVKENPELSDLQLVIVGRKDHSFKETVERIEKSPGVHYLNFVDGETLLWLYKNADLFVFPSYYEGFGFPPLEAAALGTLSAVSNISSIPEVCGEGSLYFNPYDVEDMSRAIEKGLLDTTAIKEKKTKMEENLNRFSWKKNAEETLKVYSRFEKKGE
ncbi:MAG: glycosyltransferase family 4 protein [Muribaculaceae bacterium]|nr:glycosyltransferase family 4 protein [Muribaculaceae bacterium]